MALISIICLSIPAYAELPDHSVDIDYPVTAGDYDEYILQYGKAADGNGEYRISATDCTQVQGEALGFGEAGGRSPVLIWESEGGSAEWIVTVPVDGLYTLTLDYYALRGKQTDIRFALYINGEIPFSQVKSCSFHRLFEDVRSKTDGFETDRRGNEIKPTSREISAWQTAFFTDAEGMYDSPFQFLLRRGENKIKLENLEEPVAIEALTFRPAEKVPAYAELGLNPMPSPNEQKIIKVQAENFTSKSHSSITVGYDRSTPATEPYDPKKIRMNLLSARQWKTAGESVTWSFDVAEPGYYYIGSRYRQNQVRGFFVTRSITINGEAVCEELLNQRFYYGTQWKIEHFGNGGGQAFYFDKGTYTITMEATLGSMSDPIRQNIALQKRLSEMYRKIIMITSVQPDPYQDYTLETDIPELLSVFSAVSQQLRAVSDDLVRITKSKGSEAVLIDRLVQQLESFASQPHTIASRLARFRENLSGLAEWINQVRDQPLDLDYIYLCPVSEKKPDAGAGFFSQLKHEVRSFLNTFFEDYSSINSESNRDGDLEVWVATGRDTAHVLNRLVNESFSKETGINVNLKLMQSALTQAVMSGRQPDVALNLGRGEPVNLAMRGALTPLDNMEGFDDLCNRFHKDALIPYRFNGRCYAVPEQQVFHMMFIRTDIFKELGLEIPQTWKDVYGIARILQRNNLEIGLPYLQVDAYNLVNTGMSAQSIYPTLLVQRNGSVFNKTQTATALDTPQALEAFQEWVDFYTQYSFPLFKDDYNRFRTGEMPLLITMYNFYSQLIMAAPEIRNDWTMALIPGVQQADGSINRSECASGTASVLLAGSQNADNAWKFLKWWTSADIQAAYGTEMEAMVGPAARYATANQEAFERLAWPKQDAETIKKQWQQVTEIPEIPGGYYVSRSLDNAFRACVYRKENTRETLAYWNKYSNDEITRKRRECGLE